MDSRKVKRKNLSFLSKRHFNKIIQDESVADLNELEEVSDYSDSKISPSGSKISRVCNENNETATNTELIRNADCDSPISYTALDEGVSSEDNDSSDNETELTIGTESLNSSDEEKSEGSSLKTDIANWALEFNISFVALTALLSILCKHGDTSLPRDGRTLLHTPRFVRNIIDVSPGKYVHFGLSEAVQTILSSLKSCFVYPDVLSLIINVDGVPISKSSKSCLWPILCSDTILKKVFIVGMYHGFGKPNDSNIFLKNFVDDAMSLINLGYMFSGKLISINIHALVCDVPAKSFVLKIKGHGGYSSCTKCTVTGQRFERRVCFPGAASNNRTDLDFQNNVDIEYHNGESILKSIPKFGLVSCVPLDYMHLVCLGAVRKILNLWISGPLTVRLGRKNLFEISEKLLALVTTVPSDFARKPRSLNEVAHWKATEFRQFLLYTGPVVLYKTLRQDVYTNFMTLHVAVRILISKKFSTIYIDYAKKLISHFVASFATVYGKEYVSHNIHNLLHLCDDVRKCGPLDEFSAFRFENFLQSIKKLIRKSEKPLEQLCKRYAERKVQNLQHSSFTSDKQSFDIEHNDGPVLEEFNISSQFKILKNSNFTIACNSTADKYLKLRNDTLISAKNFIYCSKQKKHFVIGHKLLPIKNVYCTPCTSDLLDIHCCQLKPQLRSWCTSDIECKLWHMPTKKYINIFPILH